MLFIDNKAYVGTTANQLFVVVRLYPEDQPLAVNF